MKITSKITAILFVGALAACENSGANYTPIVDGAVGPNYNSDLAQCQNLAATQSGLDASTGRDVATGAGVAAASSVIINDNRNNAGQAAAVGALIGLTSNQLQKSSSQEAIVRSCMRGRGYNVVG